MAAFRSIPRGFFAGNEAINALPDAVLIQLVNNGTTSNIQQIKLNVFVGLVGLLDR
jgi:hypothetical protein